MALQIIKSSLYDSPLYCPSCGFNVIECKNGELVEPNYTKFCEHILYEYISELWGPTYISSKTKEIFKKNNISFTQEDGIYTLTNGDEEFDLAELSNLFDGKNSFEIQITEPGPSLLTVCYGFEMK